MAEYKPFVGSNPFIDNLTNDLIKIKNFKNQQNREEEERLNRQQQNTYLQNLSNALVSGDDEAINQAWAQYDPQGLMKYKQGLEAADREEAFQKYLLNARQQNAIELEGLKNKNAMDRLNATGGQGGFGKSTAGLALSILSNPNDFTPEQQAWATQYLAKDNPQNIYESAMQRQAGSLAAKSASEKKEKEEISQNQSEAIDRLISDIDANPDLLGVYSPYKAMASRLTGGALGYSKEELENRGDLIRQVGAIQNNILAEARAAGQTGINTMAEIRQATKGLDENSSSEEIKGALRALKKAKNKLYQDNSTENKVNYKDKYGLE